MAVNVCAGCTTKFAVGLAWCPHCRSTDFQEDGVMPKITRHGGPSVAGVTIAEARWGDGEEQEVSAESAEAETAEEESSPGNSSETSSETPSSEPEQSETPTPSRARKTASRSKKAPTESPSAPSTDGDPADGTSATDE